MGLLNYSVTLTAGANENVNDVQTMFNEVKTVLNGNIEDANIKAGAAIDYAKMESTVEWTTYTPTINGLTLGNGSSWGSWARFGSLVFQAFWFQLGSTSSVTGGLTLSLVNSLTMSWGLPTVFEVRDDSASNDQVGMLLPSASEDLLKFYAIHTDGTYADRDNNMNASVPFNWTTSDQASGMGAFFVG